MASPPVARRLPPISWVPAFKLAGASLALGLVAAVLAAGGSKMVIVAAAGTVVGLGLLLARERARLVLVLMALTLQFILHKSIGPIDDTVTGGAISVYVSSVDAFVVLLYVLWYFEGTMAADLKALARHRLAWLPLAALGLSVFSLLNAASVRDAFAELVREAWLYALFIYVAARLRTRADMAWLLGALFVVALMQCALVIAQWKSGGHIGLSLLGEDEGLYTRVTDDSEVLRPAGTAIHPNILAAAMGPIGLMALSLALNLRSLHLRLMCAAASLVAFFPLVFSQTRAAILAAGGAALLLVGSALWARRLQWRLALALVLATVPPLWYFWPQIGAKVWDNLFTSHFSLEVESRLQLNWVALDMIRAQPFIGVGLNNFMAVFDDYSPYGVLYPGFPVHNVFLLVFAETGIVGLLALVALFAALLWHAGRLALSPDRFLSALGVGLAGVVVFFAIEEQLSYSLRADLPASLFWILAGLALAGTGLALREREVGRA